MFSSGGMLMYFHFGVAKNLFEQGLLPSVLSGSSAGALVCAVLGTRSNKELRGFFTPENICFGEEWRPNTFERVSGLRRIYGAGAGYRLLLEQSAMPRTEWPIRSARTTHYSPR